MVQREKQERVTMRGRDEAQSELIINGRHSAHSEDITSTEKERKGEKARGEHDSVNTNL
jgi:hypothetical protein